MREEIWKENKERFTELNPSVSMKTRLLWVIIGGCAIVAFVALYAGYAG